MSHNILSKTDRALVAYLVSEDAGTIDDVYPAKRSADKAVPCTVCYSERAVQDPPYSGVYEVTAAILIKTVPAVDVDEDPDAPKAASEERVGKTFDLFFAGLDTASDKLADAITAAARASSAIGDEDLADFTCQAVTVDGPEAGFDSKGNVWVDTLNLKLVVCPSNVS
jgi:hypothetical protein